MDSDILKKALAEMKSDLRKRQGKKVLGVQAIGADPGDDDEDHKKRKRGGMGIDSEMANLKSRDVKI